MYPHSRTVFITLGVISAVMICIIGFHVGGKSVLQVGVFSPLLGATIGATLVFVSVNTPLRQKDKAEPWLKREKLAWTLMGCGCLAWAIGECFWRYYLSQGQQPFPSLADFGYASFPPLVFAGLLLQPSSRSDQPRIFFLLDSLISMGALLSIVWFLLLGQLAQAPMESPLGKVLTLYYAMMDPALLSCTIFLLLRGSSGVYQAPARRFALLAVALGLALFAVSDFFFNLGQNLGTYVDGTWTDLGWPLGMMVIGAGACLRRFTFASSGETQALRLKKQAGQIRFAPAQILPYVILAILFYVLTLNVLSTNKTEQSIRPVLVLSTLIVVGLVIVRQILTMLDNIRLLRKQSLTLQELEKLNQSALERNNSLEAGITHLKEIQTRLANGEVRARSSIVSGELWPLSVGLNLMADRMMRIEHGQVQTQKQARTLEELIQALERARDGNPFVPPASCLDFPELQRLIHALGLKPVLPTSPSSPPTSSTQAARPLKSWKGFTRPDPNSAKST